MENKLGNLILISRCLAFNALSEIFAEITKISDVVLAVFINLVI
jgi:hypothetical protein